MNKFMNEIEPITRSFPYMVCPGNHDVTCHILSDSGCSPALQNFSAYRHRWNMPSKESGSGSPLWYSFNYGNSTLRYYVTVHVWECACGNARMLECG